VRFVAIVIERIFDFVTLGSTNPKRTALFDPVPPSSCVRSHRIAAAPEKIFYSNGRRPQGKTERQMCPLCVIPPRQLSFGTGNSGVTSR
jgi:hypothetical protein